MTLTRWYELECGDGNGYIERGETTGKPYYVNCNSRVICPNDPRARWLFPIASAAPSGVWIIMARYPSLRYYLQTDPRGHRCICTIQRFGWPDIDCCYSSIGTAVYR